MKNKRFDPFKKEMVAVVSDKEARKQLGWLYLWTILLLVLTMATGLAP